MVDVSYQNFHITHIIKLLFLALYQLYFNAHLSSHIQALWWKQHTHIYRHICLHKHKQLILLCLTALLCILFFFVHASRVIKVAHKITRLYAVQIISQNHKAYSGNHAKMYLVNNDNARCTAWHFVLIWLTNVPWNLVKPDNQD